MSAETLTRISCDSCGCRHDSTLAVSAARALLRSRGWARRHHEDRQVDLCASCVTKFVARPHNRGGRPITRKLLL